MPQFIVDMSNVYTKNWSVGNTGGVFTDSLGGGHCSS